MPFLASLPEGASLLSVFKAFPETSKPLLDFHEALLREPSPFSEAERELIAAYVSGLNECRYCRGVHTATAERLGIAPGAVELSLVDIDAAPISDRMRPVLRYAQKLTLQPEGVRPEDADAIVQAEWNDTALYHTVAVTALFNFVNRPVEGLGIELDPEYVKPASERLAQGGYSPLLQLIKQ